MSVSVRIGSWNGASTESLATLVDLKSKLLVELYAAQAKPKGKKQRRQVRMRSAWEVWPD